MRMRTYAIVRCMKSRNRFNTYGASFMSIYYLRFSQLARKSHNFVGECQFLVISIVLFLKL